MIGATMYFMLGRNEMVAGARSLGKVLGRSVVRVNSYRSRAIEALQSENFSSLRPELRDGFQSLMELQNEIRSASLNPVHSVQQAVMNEALSRNGAPSEPQITATSHPGSSALRKRLQESAQGSVASGGMAYARMNHGTPAASASSGGSPHHASFLDGNPALSHHHQTQSAPLAEVQTDMLSLEEMRRTAAQRLPASSMRITTEAMGGGADLLHRGLEYHKLVKAYEQFGGGGGSAGLPRSSKST